MSSVIEVIVGGDTIYEVITDAPNPLYEVTTAETSPNYEVHHIEAGFLALALINDEEPSNVRTYSSQMIEEKLDDKSDAEHTHSNATPLTSGFLSAIDKQKIDALSEVATSGSYADLNDKPTIPIAVAGENIVIDNTNPSAPIISSTSSGGSINYGLLNTQINQLGGSF